jgi:hypothetical protein
VQGEYYKINVTQSKLPGVPAPGLGFNGGYVDWLRFMLQFQYVNINKLNSTGTFQIGQRFETLSARAQAAW